jgi:hypothetical protein
MAYMGCWSACEQREDPEGAPNKVYEDPAILPNNYESGHIASEDGEQDCEEYDSYDEDSYDFSDDDSESDDYDDYEDADGG